jgi:hypothetical protein
VHLSLSIDQDLENVRMEKIRRGLKGMSDTVLKGSSVMATKVRLLRVAFVALSVRAVGGCVVIVRGGGVCCVCQMNNVGAMEITEVRDFLTEVREEKADGRITPNSERSAVDRW